MKFTCTQENLALGLATVAHLAGKNTTLPILNNVLIKAENGVVTLTTTNLELGVRCTVRGRVESEGSYTVQSRVISDLVSLASSKSLDIALVNDSLEVNGESNQSSIKGQPAEEFPSLPEIERKSPFSCKAGDFARGISQVIFAAANSETRPEISGVFLKFMNGSLVLAATDSYRLAEKSIKCGGVESREAIVPARTMAEVQRVVGGSAKQVPDDESNVEIYFQDNQILFIYQNIEIVSRLIEGTYPDYKQIIPKTFKTTALVEIKDLLKAAKTSSLFSRAGVNDVNLELREKEIKVFANNSNLGSSSQVIEAKVEGGPNKIVLNHKYLLDGLNVLNSTVAAISMNDEASPFVLKGAETLSKEKPVISEDYLYIVMPIRQ